MLNEDITEEEVTRFRLLLDHLRQFARDGVDSDVVEKYLLEMLEHSIPFFSHLVLEYHFQEITRLSINRRVIGSNSRIHNIKFLGPPPAEKVKSYGRCNMPGMPVFYGCFNPLTAVGELKPQIGDLITVSKWKSKGSQPIKYVPIFKRQPQNHFRMDKRIPDIQDLIREKNRANFNQNSFNHNQLYENLLMLKPKNFREQVDALVEFVADAFSKMVDPNNPRDYLISAFFSNVILNKFEGGSIDAIYYPSVQQNLTLENIAIKPSALQKKYELVEVSDMVVTDKPQRPNPGIFMEGLGDSTSFDYVSGKIFWPDRFPDDERILALNRAFGVTLD